MNQSINQSMNESINQSINQSINESINQSEALTITPQCHRDAQKSRTIPPENDPPGNINTNTNT